MKNSEKKTEKKTTAPATEKGGAAANVEKKKIKLSPTAIAFTVTAAIVLIIGVIVAVIYGTKAAKQDKNFDYLKSNLSKYVDFSEDDYKSYDIEIDIAKPHSYDADVALLNLLASKKGEVKNEGAMITSPVTITAGDVVHIWYRGYMLDDDGEEIYTAGMCNFSGAEASPLEIGSGQFVPGFELHLAGKNTGDYPKFVKITEGEVTEEQIAYVSYKRLVEGGDEKKDTKSATVLRLELSDTSLDETYGAGFREQLLAATVGEKVSFGVTLDGKTHNYTELTVDFVTECEVEPLVVECYFPYDYSTATLRNQTAYFEVYVAGVVQYECPEFNDEFVLKLVGSEDANYTEEEIESKLYANPVITESELLEYEGETLVEKYRSYAQKLIDEAYEENYEAMVEDAMWNHFLEKAEIKKYPAIKVDAIHQEYIDDVYYQFEQTGGSIQNQYTEEYEYYETVDEFAVAYLGLTYSENQDWRSVLYTMSENLVKERLIMYYLMQEEDLMPSAKELEEELAKVKEEYIDEYVKQYLEYENKTRADYTDEEYAAFVEDRKAELFDYYDEDYFVETTYYEIGLREFRKWANVSTLDDRSALPQDK